MRWSAVWAESKEVKATLRGDKSPPLRAHGSILVLISLEADIIVLIIVVVAPEEDSTLRIERGLTPPSLAL